MSDVAIQRFSCDGCGKRYPWKPEISKKRVKCKCGAVMTVPDLSAPPEDDGPPTLPGDDIFDIVEQQREIAPPRYQAMEAAAVAAMPSAAPARGSNRPNGRPAALGYASGKATPRQREREAAIHDLTRDVYAPLGLIVGSFLAYFIWLMIDGRGGTGSLLVYGIGMTVLFAVKTVFMIGGAFVVASVGGVSFGPFWTAVLKLAAVAIAPDIFATILEEMINSPGAGLLAGSLALGLYWVLIAWLFSMDANEAWMVVILFGVLRWILTFVIGMLILGMFMSGGVGLPGGGGGNTTQSASAEAVEFDHKVAEWKEINRLEESLAYIKRTSRQSAMQDVSQKLYDAGAKNVWFSVARDINGKAEPLSLVIEWPRDAEKRAAVLGVIQAFDKQRYGVPTTGPTDPDEDVDPEDASDLTEDNGGKFIEIDLLGS